MWKQDSNITPYYIYCCRALKENFPYERKIVKQILASVHVNYNLVTVPKHAPFLLKAVILTNAFSKVTYHGRINNI